MPSLFTPYTLRELEFRNRVFVLAYVPVLKRGRTAE